MQCTRCGETNPEHAKFCIECGTPFAARCPHCAAENPVRAKFCASCGTPLTGQGAKPSPPAPQPPAAERRHLTVMFCDLVGSTALSTRLDPEELREVVRSYQSTCTTVIQRYDGCIAQHLGDGLLVYFGYPTAHEDDAARAVRAGLAIMHALREQEQQTPIQIRIGIHTGVVVIGEIGSSEKREMLALGETPNIAARVQGQANPDEVLISAATHRLVEGLFDTEERGQPELKGVATPLTLYRVTKESEAHSRFAVGVRKGLTPLIGREHEFGLFRERWERVKEGSGQVVLLSGEPGIGKSRLVEALKETAEHEGARVWELRCSPYTQNSALAPAIELIQRMLGFHSTDTVEEKLHKLMSGIPHVVSHHSEIVSLFAAFLSLPQAPTVPVLTYSPQKHKEKTYEALVTWLCRAAQQQAVIYAWEDLHWADPSTLELLALFLPQIPTTRLLTVLTFRPEFTPPWGAHAYLSQLSLSRLGRSHVAAMIEKVTGGHALPIDVVQQIVNKTDGVPLFVEELTKSVVESREATDRAPGHMLDIPATLQDSLMARLDRLGTAKEIAQLGATLGREFSYELLYAVSALSEERLQQGLHQLVDAELVYQSGSPPQSRYLFKHALVQDAAYQSLLKSRRQQLHQHVAQVLVEQFPQTVEMQPELLAYHYTEAGLIEQAIPFWQRAGEGASKRLALKEAIAHLKQGLALIGTLPLSPEREEQELDIRIRLGTAWMGLKGQGVSEVWTSLHPALRLAKSLGRQEALVPIYWGLSVHVSVQGRVAESLDWVKDMLATAEASGDRDLLIVSHWAACTVYHWLGDFSQEQEHGDRLLALYDTMQHCHIVDLTNIDPKTGATIHGSLATWILGYPDRAVQESEAIIAHARQLGHPYNLGWALHMSSWLWDFRGEPAQMLVRAEETKRLGHTHSLPILSDVLAPTIEGIASLRAGRFAESIPPLRSAIETWNAHGVEITIPYYRAVLAEGLALSGDLASGLRLIEESLAQIARPGWEERCLLAEILRLKGWMLVLQDDLTGAEQQYLASLDVAREQEAKSLELRATTSLVRLWQQQGKRAEAHKLLSEVYHWFTEGFETKDLQEAKALLASLAG
ncbi:MAG: AAA family ATPase, partial [Deltaproteobacteria bacterium]|nr:AAA family ATPase [Deltaproteobacteria bacterium]